MYGWKGEVPDGEYLVPLDQAEVKRPGKDLTLMGYGKVMRLVVEDNDEIVIRSRMILNLSCDHRVIDGLVAAGFLTELKGLVEEPMRALY